MASERIEWLEHQAELALAYYFQLPPADFKGHLEAARDHDRFVAEANRLRAQASA